MPGPPPKHPSDRRRRNAAPGMVQLPAEGRRGKPPKWPLSKPRKTELGIWAELWATPQAVAWAELGWIRTVARYVRLLYEAEKPGAGAAVNAEVRQLEDRLGLTPMSMRRLQWEIAADEVDEKREQRAASSTRRLKAVDPAAAAATS